MKYTNPVLAYLLFQEVWSSLPCRIFCNLQNSLYCMWKIVMVLSTTWLLRCTCAASTSWKTKEVPQRPLSMNLRRICWSERLRHLFFFQCCKHIACVTNELHLYSLERTLVFLKFPRKYFTNIVTFFHSLYWKDS
jgi:hypothetical protein